VYALKWGARADAADMYAYTREIAAAYKEQGAKLVAILVVPAGSPVPDEAARKAQAALLPEIYKYTSRAIIVFEGDGFILSLKRSALTAILLMSGGQYPMDVRHSVAEALVTNPPRRLGLDRLDGERVLTQLRALGFTS
jgi:hypothetical protein